MKSKNLDNQKESFLTYFAMVCALILTTISTAYAGGFTVNSTLDHKDLNPGDGKCAAAINICTLRAAIEEANAETWGADTITFDSSFNPPNRPKTIVLKNGPLQIKSNLSVFGTGARQLIIDGDYKSTVFFISPDTHGGISGLTIQNGYSHEPFVSISGAGVTNYGSYGFHNVTIRNNFATNDEDPSQGEHGGGIRNYGEMYLYFSTVTGNKAGVGGGIYNTGAIRIWNSTISGNSSFYGGGGIYHAGGEILIAGATVANNLSQFQPGGGIWNELNFPLHMANTIVADNNSAFNKDVHGSFISGGNNLIENRGGSAGYVASDLPDGTDPMLDVLQNNGGTTDTHALLAGSPAINAGNNCPSISWTGCQGGYQGGYDQRTYPFARIGTMDIGAFEFQGESPQFVKIAGKVLKPNNRGLNNAVVTLTGDDGEPLSVETDPHGNFSFDQVSSNKSYVISVQSRQYNYAAQTLLVTQARDDVNFAPVEDRIR